MKLFKAKVKNDALEVESNIVIRKLVLGDGTTYKLPEPLTFPLYTPEERITLQTFEYLVKTYLEEVNND